ncbi:hypothetical protein D9M69_618410 [compost metagenome]
MREQFWRQAIVQLFAQHLIDRARTAGNRDQCIGICGGRGQAGDQGAFAMPDQDQPAVIAIGLEQLAPGGSVGDILLDSQVALVRGGRTAGGDPAFVVTHAGDAVLGQRLGQALEAVVVAAVWVVAIAVGRPGAGNQQGDRQRSLALRAQ